MAAGKEDIPEAEHNMDKQFVYQTPVSRITQLPSDTPAWNDTYIDASYKTPCHPIKQLTSGVPTPSPSSAAFLNSNTFVVSHDLLSSTPTPAVLTSHQSEQTSPNTVVKLYNESTLFTRMIVVDEDQNQNSSALESDFTKSPVEKIELVECRMAKSPWFLRIHHIDRDESVTVPFYQWVETAEHQELASIWVAHKLPHYIELTGQSIRDVFVGAIDSTHDIVDISIRRLRQLDFDMCKAHSADHWRHYIESDFALLCLAGEDPIRSKSVRAQFTGQSVHYNIRKCRMFRKIQVVDILCDAANTPESTDLDSSTIHH